MTDTTEATVIPEPARSPLCRWGRHTVCTPDHGCRCPCHRVAERDITADPPVGAWTFGIDTGTEGAALVAARRRPDGTTEFRTASIDLRDNPEAHPAPARDGRQEASLATEAEWSSTTMANMLTQDRDVTTDPIATVGTTIDPEPQTADEIADALTLTRQAIAYAERRKPDALDELRAREAALIARSATL
jgi:hypothetical protein